MKNDSEPSLFAYSRKNFLAANAPLADRMRPRTLDDFCGQEKIIGPGRLLRRAIQADQLSSLIFYGPPGSGKTTLARIIANTTKADFITLNAVLSGVKDIRAAVEQAQGKLGSAHRRTILFIDEVHRFNKVQQDALLPHVENGTVIFIGATTENPYFEVNKALLSRSRIFALTTLANENLAQVAQQAIKDPERGYGKLAISFTDGALEHLVEMANGDARALLNALELAVQTTEPEADGRININQAVAEESIQKKAVLYDKDGDAHYDVISAFIKSIRGSDPDAALYWLAKMVYAGEDPRFIFRRMLISASEDIGMADPHALTVVSSAAKTFDYVGLPEGRFAMAHACVYLATAPKSNSLFAFFSALESVGKEQEGEVPDHLKDAARDGEDLGHGRDYLYPHAYRDHWVAQQYLPTTLQGRLFYQPADTGYEKGIKGQVERRREEQLAAFLEEKQGQDNPQNELFFAAHCHGPTRVQNQWLKRTLENTGKQLGEMRDAIYRAAAGKQEALILTINDNGGLLTWEGLRQAPMGGVYALLDNEEAAATLKAQAENLDPLERPVLISGGLEVLEAHCQQEQGLLFDLIPLRGLKQKLESNNHFLSRLNALLAPQGRLISAESLPRFQQRLYQLLPESALPTETMTILAQAEEAIYSHPSLDWCEEEYLREMYEKSPLQLKELHLEKNRHQVYLSGNDLDNWFTPRGKGEKDAYCQHLAAHLSPEALATVKKAFIRHLQNKVCRWESVTAYLILTRA